MRVPKFNPKKIEVHGKECWQINIPENFSVTGKRSRPIFKTKSDAEAESKKLRLNAAKFGSNLPTLPHDVHAKVVRALKLLEPYKIDIDEAARQFVSRFELQEKSITFCNLVDEVVALKISEGRSEVYIKGLRQKAKRFCPFFGEKKICDIEPREIDLAVDGLNVSVNSMRSYKKSLKVVFSKAVDWNYLSENPVKNVATSYLPSKEIEILEVGQVERLLEESSPETLPYYVLGVFCGIRPKEIERLSWEQVDFDTKEVEVKAKYSKTKKRRFVRIEDSAMEWLEPYRNESGPIVSKNFRAKFDHDRKESGLYDQWSHDVLRHTYGSYHCAYFENLPLTAIQMGHAGLQVLEDHYRKVVRKEVASEFWAIRPKRKGN